VVNAAILPFPPAGGVNAPRRPSSTAGVGDDFAGAMHGALDTRATRRDDSSARAPRRSEPARPREAADSKAAAPARKPANPAKAASARTADRVEEPEPKAVDRDDEPSNQTCAASDSPEPPAEEIEADATGEGDTADVADADVEAVVVSTAAPVTDAAAVSDGNDDDAAIPADDRMARGRRWDGLAAEQDVEPDKAARTRVARGGGGATASHGVRVGQPATGQPTEAGVVTGAPLAEMSHQAAVAAQADATAAAAAKDAVVTQAVEAAAAKPQTASTADAMTAIENAVANVEAVAAAETSTSADANGADTREQAQPKPQVPGPLSNGSETVAVSGPSDGMRFTVNSAAGNAYANAAPRHEEAVLPQIVQSIRLHAVQGTTEARVQLRPEHLGALNITLRVEQNQVTATIQADVAAVRAWIESHEASLRQALSEQGLHLAKLVVHEDGQQASKDEHDGERTRRQPRRRSWRDTEATFEVVA